MESSITRKPGYLDYPEFYDLIVNSGQGGARKRRVSPEEEEREAALKEAKKECLLTEDQFTIMKEIFEKLDIHKDLVVPRTQLIDAIKNDVRMKKYLDVGVVYVPLVGKEIPLRKVLHQIEQEEFMKAESLAVGGDDFISSKKYISWH